MYNIPSLKIGLLKRKIVFQSSIFMCYVSFREGIPGTLLQLWQFGRFTAVKIFIYNQGENAPEYLYLISPGQKMDPQQARVIILPTKMQPLSGKSLKFTIDLASSLIPQNGSHSHAPCKQYPKLDSQALLFIPTERLKSDSWDFDFKISPR